MKNKVLVFAVGVVGIIAAFTTAASAHNAEVSGVTQCDSGARVISWTVVNDQQKLSTVIVLSSNQSGLGKSQLSLPAGGTGHVKQTLDQAFTGSVTLTADGTWEDGFKNSATGEVTVADSCVPVTTTTPTTVPVTTTIPVVPTTAVVVVSPAQITAPAAAAPQVKGALAFTGSGTHTALLAGGAGLLLLLGWLLIHAAREMKNESEALDYVKSVRSK